MRVLALVAVLALAACAAAAPARRAPAPEAGDRPVRAALAAGTEGGFENGRLSSPGQVVAGPFVLTYLAPGATLEVVSTGSAEVLGAVTGPIAQPLPVAGGTALRLPGPGEAVYGGYRPMPITRPLEAYLGRQILVGPSGGQAEPWFLREIGGDHVTLERSRTYRVLPLRRIAEITWTDLSGFDPAPRIVLAPP